MPIYLYEFQDGACYGYFSGRYLYDMAGKCTHYRGGSNEKYLYAMEGGRCEFYQSGKYFYTLQGAQCRWYHA